MSKKVRKKERERERDRERYRGKEIKRENESKRTAPFQVSNLPLCLQHLIVH